MFSVPTGARPKHLAAAIGAMMLIMSPAPASADLARRWEPESFGAQPHASPLARTRGSLRMVNEARWSHEPTDTGDKPDPRLKSHDTPEQPLLDNHLLLAIDLEVGLLSEHLGLFGQATFAFNNTLHEEELNGTRQLNSAMGGIKGSHSIGPLTGALGMAAGVGNQTADTFASSDDFLLKGFASLRYTVGPVVMGGSSELQYVTRLGDEELEYVQIAFSGRLAVFLHRWFSLQAEVAGKTLLNSSTHNLTVGEAHPVYLDGVAGLRFGRNFVNLGLGAAIPITHRGERHDLGILLDLAFFIG